MALLEVEGLVKYFGRRLVVNGVSFNVNAGEVVGLLGPNGAGKTTSFRMATGQIAPNGGRVTFNGEDVTGLPMYQRARRGMGYLSQEPSVFRKLSVEKNLMAILEALPRSRSLGRKLTSKERWQRTDDALARFKLETVRKNAAARCSGGEKRRLEIARCLVCEPLLILLDEPFAAVDPKTTEDIRQNIRDLAKSGIGILITDHNVREVFRSADRVYLITEGKVVTRGTPHELVNDQIAIDAYLGRSFEEDGFTRHFAARPGIVPGGTGAAERTPPPAPPRSGEGSKTVAPPSLSGKGAGGLGSAPRPAPSVTTVTPPPVEFPKPPPPPTAFPAVTPAPVFPMPESHGGVFAAPVGTALELEKLRRAVENLTDDDRRRTATAELLARGGAAIPVLLDALERRERPVRHLAFEVLKHVARDFAPLAFDPDAADDVRLRQISYLRAKITQRS